MSQRANRKTKIKKKIDEAIKQREKYLLESEYRDGVVVGLKIAKELISNS